MSDITLWKLLAVGVYTTREQVDDVISVLRPHMTDECGLTVDVETEEIEEGTEEWWLWRHANNREGQT
jgi:hypothetical protein